MDPDPQVERGREVLFARAERMWPDDGEGLRLADVMASLKSADQVAVRAFFAAVLRELDEEKPSSPSR